MMASPQMSSSEVLDPAKGTPGSTRPYKRASRKGAPRRFECQHPGCDKLYTRAEHLQRHQLNHNPTEIFECDIGGCDQRFVRLDLLARHKKRHNAEYTPRNRLPSFKDPRDDDSTMAPSSSPTSSNSQPRNSFHHPQQHRGHPNGPHDAAILLTPDSNTAATPSTLSHAFARGHRDSVGQSWTSPVDERAQFDLMRPRTTLYGGTAGDAAAMGTFPEVPYSSEDQLVQANFAAWLFDPQTSFNDLGVASLPFLEGGLESTFNSNIHYDYDSLNGRSPTNVSPHHSDAGDDVITEARRQDLLQWFHIFRKKQPRFDSLMQNMLHDSRGDSALFTQSFIRDCLNEFWERVSPRLPIVHQYTFSQNSCPLFLLFVIISLGAASMKIRDTSGMLSEYSAFADVIITSVRWEILTSDDATPPAELWVAQALLLVEFYEKLYSSRRLHERAHIFHPAFLTLLRRGSPLIGRGGSESPPEPSSIGVGDRANGDMSLDSRSWWVRWAETESMHRVVFAAFMLDVIHAAMFGHAADMAAHEIRLPLPCDDNLWSASSPDVVRQLEANFRMYGVKQVSFLDGLKSALHGKEVKTHSFGRMIILSGLLSVGWHLSHRETHLRWLDLRGPSSEMQDSWRKMLLKAFDNWKGSFDVAMSDYLANGPQQRGIANGPINSAAVLFHLTHITLHTDIIDFQLYSGAKRLLGRKVSSRDHANAVKRMTSWAKQESTRHAVLHAFKLLYAVLVDANPRKRAAHSLQEPLAVQYSIKTDPDPHRPWIMYYATLTIWAFVQALSRPAGNPFPEYASHRTYSRIADYLYTVSSLKTLDEKSASLLYEGVPELLDVVEAIFAESEIELLAEARERLRSAKELLLGNSR